MTKSPYKDPRGTDPSAAPGAIGHAGAASAFSIFHEPWWLDIVTDGDWTEAVVSHEGAVVGRLPYACTRSHGLRVATMPRLVPTLGPAIAALPGKAATSLRRQLEITNALIDQLPDLACFEQVFDPRIHHAAGFVYRGFVEEVSYCFRIPHGLAPQDVWCGMQAGRRQQILDAATELRIDPVDDIEELFRLDGALVRGRNAAKRVRGLLRAIRERDAGMVLGARDRAGALVAAIMLVWDSAATYRLVGVRQTGAQDAVESVLLWEAVQLVSPQKRAFDLGAIGLPASLRFLAGFGDYLTERVAVRRINRQYRLRKTVASLFGVSAV
jgi:hypothetical protein